MTWHALKTKQELTLWDSAEAGGDEEVGLGILCHTSCPWGQSGHCVGFGRKKVGGIREEGDIYVCVCVCWGHCLVPRLHHRTVIPFIAEQSRAVPASFFTPTEHTLAFYLYFLWSLTDRGVKPTRTLYCVVLLIYTNCTRLYAKAFSFWNVGVKILAVIGRGRNENARDTRLRIQNTVFVPCVILTHTVSVKYDMCFKNSLK